MESTDSSTGSQQPQLPPGFRFHPTDEELVVHYLKKKAASAPLPVSIIAEVDLYKFDPWELPAKATFGEQEWYFFSPRDRKYPNGARPNRAATSGYWKATGTDKPVVTAGGTKVGVKKALVFYGGKPPKGIKSNWIMHEYRLIDNKASSKPPGCDVSKKGSLRLDDWVLCRIYKKTNTPRPVDHESDDINDMMQSIPSSIPSLSITDHHKLQGLKTSNFGGFLQNEHNMFDGMITNAQLTSSISAASQLPLLGGSTAYSSLPAAAAAAKRTFPQLYWTDENGSTSPSATAKRYMTENNDGSIGPRSTDDHTNSFASLLGQLPSQTTTQMQQPPTMLGSLSDGMFRQVAGMNWYS